MLYCILDRLFIVPCTGCTIVIFKCGRTLSALCFCWSFMKSISHYLLQNADRLCEGCSRLDLIITRLSQENELLKKQLTEERTLNSSLQGKLELITAKAQRYKTQVEEMEGSRMRHKLASMEEAYEKVHCIFFSFCEPIDFYMRIE